MAVFPSEEVKPAPLSNHDRSYYLRNSMGVGPLYPIACVPVNGGDDNFIDVASLVNTQALLNPLYGSYKLKIMAFFGGTSLYIPRLWRNGSMRNNNGLLDVDYPTFKLSLVSKETFPKMPTINSTQLLAYLGFNPGFADVMQYTGKSGDKRRPFSALPLLMYWDIWRHYFVNRQEKTFPYFSYDSGSSNRSNPYYSVGTLSELDQFFESGLPASGGDITDTLPKCIQDAFKLNVVENLGGYQPMQGLALGTHLPDRMNVILNKEFIQANVTSVKVDISSDSLQFDQLVQAKKLWTSRVKDAFTNGTFKDWVRIHYGVTPAIMDDMPTFLGATSVDINFEDIRATTTSVTEEGTQYLGDKGSSGFSLNSSRGFRCTADRPGFVMILAQIVPRVDYYQNLERFTMHTKLSDEFRPEYNNFGYQDVLVSDLNADFTGCEAPDPDVTSNFSELDPTTNGLGYQPAYTELMTQVNKLRGSMCTTEKSWVLARDFRSKPTPLVGGPVTTYGPTFNTQSSAYIFPDDWQQPFAVRAAYAENFLTQFRVRNTVRSQVSKRLIPKW